MDTYNNNEIKSCSFFGHRDIENSLQLQSEIEQTIIDLILNKNVGIFYFGGFGDFDILCHTTVRKIMKQFPYLKCIFCATDDKHIKKLKKYKMINFEEYDQIISFPLEFDYWYTRIYYRNCEIIKQSDYTVFYIRNKENSGAYKCYKYAQKLHKKIISL
ncbi:MAG: hypothetical protein R3Y45_02185 [Bacillota bacterium]